MQQALVVGLGDFLRQEDAAGQVPADDAGNVVPLGRGYGGILVGVLLSHLLVGVVEQVQDGLVCGVLLPGQGADVAVDDIGLGQLIFAGLHQFAFYHVLDVLHQQPGPVQRLHGIGDGVDLFLGDPKLRVYRIVGLLDGNDDFHAIKIDCVPVSLNDFHRKTSISHVPIMVIISQFGLFVPWGARDARSHSIADRKENAISSVKYL